MKIILNLFYTTVFMALCFSTQNITATNAEKQKEGFVVSSNESCEPKLTVSIGFDDRIYRVGDVLNTTVTITNVGVVDAKNIAVDFNLPHQIVSSGKMVQHILFLAAGKSASVLLSCRIVEAGRGMIYYKITADDFSAQEVTTVSIAGAGWYGGDNHSHSTYSDGRGTIQQNSDVAYKKGMSWNYTADHNNRRARDDSKRITSEGRGDFIALVGVEIDNLIGHALAFQMPENVETYVIKTIYEGYFDALPDGEDKPLEVKYFDTNLEGSDIYFGELFGGKTLEYITIPGMGRATDYANIDMKGKIALVARGEFTLVEKINTAMAAGAEGVIVYNYNSEPLGMTLNSGVIGIGILQKDGLKLAAKEKGTIQFRNEPLPPKAKKTWQMMIDEVNASGAFFVPAHPGSSAYPFLEIYDIRNFAGLEVWNGTNPKAAGNILAFQQWDNSNARGDAKYFGMANSDAHDANIIAVAYNMAYMNELSVENINKEMKNGTFFGSNGPQLRFEIDGVSMGETLYINEDKQITLVKIRAFDDLYPLTEINLYKLKTVGEATDTKHLVQTWDLKSKNIKHWHLNFELEVSVGEIYRIEVNSEKSTSSDGATKGFAYSNPIWIEKTNEMTTNKPFVKNITLNNPNAELLQTKAGNYYIITNNATNLNAEHLIISVSEKAIVEKMYDAENKLFNIKISSQDGAYKRSMKIFEVKK